MPNSRYLLVFKDKQVKVKKYELGETDIFALNDDKFQFFKDKVRDLSSKNTIFRVLRKPGKTCFKSSEGTVEMTIKKRNDILRLEIIQDLTGPFLHLLMGIYYSRFAEKFF
ncbi:MAG: hypothetical protein ACTSRW_10410 [Candidatus Helarchaeota archaeon]